VAAASVVFVAVWNRPTRTEPVATQPLAPAAATQTAAPQPEITANTETKPATKAAPNAVAEARRAVAPKHKALPEIAKRQEELIAPASPATPVPSQAPGAAPLAQLPFRAADGAVAPPALRGTVHDPSGAPVSHASIEVTGASGGIVQATTGPDGRFVIPANALVPGAPYTLTANAAGFAKERRTGITLLDNQPVPIDILLQPGNVSETVAVASAPPPPPVPPLHVAVLDFVNSEQAADMVSSGLARSGVSVINRAKVKQAQQNRPSSARDAAAIGRAVGADAVITGSVKGDRTDKVAVTAEVVDTKKGGTTKVAATGPSLQHAASNLAIKLESQLGPPLSGKVTRVDESEVTVAIDDRGSPRIGQRLEVFRGQRRIGELTLTAAYGRTAVGTFSGPVPPRPGDRVAMSP